jgi:hypothetical protein
MDAAAFVAVTFDTPSSRTFSIKTVDIDAPLFTEYFTQWPVLEASLAQVLPYLAHSGDSGSVSFILSKMANSPLVFRSLAKITD